MKITVRPCSDCDRGMVSQTIRMRFAALRTVYVAHGAHGLCQGCYTRARYHGRSGFDPVPRATRRNTTVGTPCRGCGRGMIPKGGARSSRPQRFVTHFGHGLCTGCYSRASRCGTLPNPAIPAPLDAVTLARLRAAVGIRRSA